jgi:hypothetical protein
MVERGTEGDRVHRIATRVRIVAGLVRAAVEKDLLNRHVRRADEAMTAAATLRDDEVRVRVGSRSLPARRTSFSPLVAHRGDLARRIVAALAADGMQTLVVPHESRSGAPFTLAVIDGSTHRVGPALSGLEPQAGLVFGVPSDLVPGAVAAFRRPSDPAGPDAEAQVIDVIDVATGEHAGSRFVHAFGGRVRLQFWGTGPDGTWVAPGRIGHVPQVPIDEQVLVPVERPEGWFPTLRAWADPDISAVTFPIDVVYTWVDGEDPDWRRRKRAAAPAVANGRVAEAADGSERFRNRDELRYSLRSVDTYAPWVRHVWIVTDGQVPPWLDTDAARVTVVDHREIWPAPGALPTFNSHAIEANLHRIEGLSEHFLYLNDDVFLAGNVDPETFFEPDGDAHLFLSPFLVGLGATVVGEPASDSAGKNARTLISGVTGRRLSHKLFHAPFALRRSISREIEERFPDAVARTRRSVLRSIDDVALAGSLHLYYAYATGRAVGTSLRYRYVDVGLEDAATQLDRLQREHELLEVFCLNDATTVADPEHTTALVTGFLARYFPNPSGFERDPDPDERERQHGSDG